MYFFRSLHFCRLVIENFQKYGFLIKMRVDLHNMYVWDRSWPSLLALLTVVGSPCLAHSIETYASESKVTLKQATVAHTLLIIAVFFIPIFTVYYSRSHFDLAIVLMFVMLTFWMKLVSFAHVRTDLRRGFADSKDKSGSSASPTLAHVYFFVAAPTLVYQDAYPRSPSIRWRFVVRRLLELLACTGLQLFMIEQYVVPTIRNSLTIMDQGDLPRLAERVLKLAVPNTCIWLLMFYGVFHAFLNLTAELLRFGDRLFYRDW
jgi:diacylglycerol O-acyltransferase-1